MPFDPSTLQTEDPPAKTFNPSEVVKPVDPQDTPETPAAPQPGADPSFDPLAAAQTGLPVVPPETGAAFFKPGAAIVGGAGQLTQDALGPRTPGWVRSGTKKLSDFGRSPNADWAGTAMEGLGWALPGAAASPLGMFAAPTLGGLYATESGSPKSHAIGSIIGALSDLPFRYGLPYVTRGWDKMIGKEREVRLGNTKEFSRRLDELEKYADAAEAQETAPQKASEEWIRNAMKGTGAVMPKGLSPTDRLAYLAEWSGKRLGQLNSKMDWLPTDKVIDDLRQQSTIVGQSIGEGLRGEWSNMFNRNVLADITGDMTTRAGVPIGRAPQRITGGRFAAYVARLRGLSDEQWKLARNDPPNFADRRKMAIALRKFADQAEDLAEGPDKPLRDKVRMARAKMGTLGRAASPEKGDLPTPEEILRQREHEVGGAEQLRTRMQREQILRRMSELAKLHRTRPEQPYMPGVPHEPPQHPMGQAAAAGAAHLAHSVVPGASSFVAYHALREPGRLAQMARAARQYAAETGRVTRRLAPALGGALAAYGNPYYDQDEQSPTGGVTP